MHLYAQKSHCSCKCVLCNYTPILETLDIKWDCERYARKHVTSMKQCIQSFTNTNFFTNPFLTNLSFPLKGPVEKLLHQR